MESVDKELSKSIQRHLDSSKLNTEIADQYSSLSCARKKGRKQLHLVAVVVVGGGGGGGGVTLRYRFFVGFNIQILSFVVSTNDGPDMWTNKDINMTSSPLSTPSRQYMETLKRNYFV